MFVQLLLGLHLLVPQDLKTEDQPKKKIWMNNFAQNLFLETFNSLTCLFSPEADLDEYGRLVGKLRSLSDLTSWEHNAILAFILLFQPGINNPMKDLDATYSFYLQPSGDSLKLPNLINVLSSMVNFCTDNFEWNNFDLNNHIHSQPLPTFNIF